MLFVIFFLFISNRSKNILVHVQKNMLSSTPQLQAFSQKTDFSSFQFHNQTRSIINPPSNPYNGFLIKINSCPYLEFELYIIRTIHRSQRGTVFAQHTDTNTQNLHRRKHHDTQSVPSPFTQTHTATSHFNSVVTTSNPQS